MSKSCRTIAKKVTAPAAAVFEAFCKGSTFFGALLSRLPREVVDTFTRETKPRATFLEAQAIRGSGPPGGVRKPFGKKPCLLIGCKPLFLIIKCFTSPSGRPTLAQHGVVRRRAGVFRGWHAWGKLMNATHTPRVTKHSLTPAFAGSRRRPKSRFA